MLSFWRKSFLTFFFITIKVSCRKRQIWILVITTILFMIQHHKDIPLIRIHNMNVLVQQEKLFLLQFSLTSKFICQNRQTWILVIISIIFTIWHRKHILLIRINNIDALVLYEEPFLPPFSLQSKFICQKRQPWILVIISIIFMILPHKHILLIGINDTATLVLQEKLFFP